MLTWLKMLPMELDSITEYLNPGTPIDYKDKIIGTASNDLKKLYTLWRLKEKEAEQNKIDIKFGKSQEERTESIIFLRKNMEIFESLRGLFWIAVKDEFDLWKVEASVGIRSGFTVVTTDRYPEENIMDILFGRY